GSLYNNPYALLVQGYRQQNKSNLQPQVELHQDLEGVIQGLKLRFMGYVQRNSSFAISRSYNPFFYSAGSLDGSDITLTPINPGGPGSFGTTGSEYLSYGEGEKELKSSLYTETALNYNRIFKENHSVGAMVVTTMRNSLTGNAGTLERSLPKRNMGVSGRVTYGYKETYLTEFNFGYNGTERFAANHRYGFFPAIGFGYNISNEPFFKPLTSVISRFKLRGTYGLNGNDAIGRDEDRFFYLSNVDLTGGPGASFGEDPSNLYTRPGVTVLRYANDRITWETSRQLNLGADISLFNDINLTIDAYRKTTSNILQPRSAVPTTMGLLADAVANVGKSQSQGIDFQADYNKSLGTKTWMQLRGTMTYATNKILFYDEPTYPASTSYLTKVGRSFDQQLGFVAERLFTDDIEVSNSPSQSAIAGGVAVRGGDIKYRDMNNDGLINNDDRVFMGLPTTPEMVYGFGFSLTHGSFDLNAQVQGSARSSLFINAGGFNFNNLNQSGISPFVQAGGYQSGLLKAIADDHWS
ncbi:MAG: SusC/RagA family TonB-linked outer membrane protein, partial [Sphingobacteriales bacterium]